MYVFLLQYTDVVGTKYSTYLGKNVFPKTAGGSDMRVYLLLVGKYNSYFVFSQISSQNFHIS